MTTTKHFPVDNEEIDNQLTDEDWERTEGAHDRLMAFVEASPRAKARYDSVLSEIDQRQATLRKVREARALTQATIAELLGMDQSEVSRLERRSDILLSTLRRFIGAAGGELRLVVSFPDMAPAELRLDEPETKPVGPSHQHSSEERWVHSRKEVHSMTTSKKDASEAGKLLANPKTSKTVKSVAASDLAQTKSGKRKK